MQRLAEDIFRLAPPGGVFDQTVIRNLHPDASEGARRLLVHRAVTKGEILRLRPGLFMLANPFQKSPLDAFALVSLLHGPSHVSLESALSFHGLIPEAVYQITCVTSARSRRFQTPAGDYVYKRVPARDPRAGVKAVKMPDRSWAFIATPLRAIADKVYLAREVTWKKDGLGWLTDSLRIEEDDLETVSFAPLASIRRGLGHSRVIAYLSGLREAVTGGG